MELLQFHHAANVQRQSRTVGSSGAIFSDISARWFLHVLENTKVRKQKKNRRSIEINNDSNLYKKLKSLTNVFSRILKVFDYRSRRIHEFIDVRTYKRFIITLQPHVRDNDQKTDRIRMVTDKKYLSYVFVYRRKTRCFICKRRGAAQNVIKNFIGSGDFIIVSIDSQTTYTLRVIRFVYTIYIFRYRKRLVM